MTTLEKVLLTMLSLIALYLVLANAGAFDTIIKSLTAMQTGVFGVLQGRDVSVSGVTVGAGASAGKSGGGKQFFPSPFTNGGFGTPIYQ